MALSKTGFDRRLYRTAESLLHKPHVSHRLQAAAKNRFIVVLKDSLIEGKPSSDPLKVAQEHHIVGLGPRAGQHLRQRVQRIVEGDPRELIAELG